MSDEGLGYCGGEGELGSKTESCGRTEHPGDRTSNGVASAFRVGVAFVCPSNHTCMYMFIVIIKVEKLNENPPTFSMHDNVSD